jgi:hypothetical protein
MLCPLVGKTSGRRPKTHLERGLRSLLIRRPQRSWHLHPIALSLVRRDRSNPTLHPNRAKALSYVPDLVITDKSVSRSIVNWGPSDLTNAWTAGRAAMMINGSWEIPNIRSAKLGFNWVVGPLPKDLQSVSILGGEREFSPGQW